MGSVHSALDGPSAEAKRAAGMMSRVSDVRIGVLEVWATHEQPVTLKVKERRFSWSGDTFFIRDAVSNEPVLECQGKFRSVRSSKEFKDAKSGQTLFHLKNRVLSFHATFDAFSPDDTYETRPLFKVKKGVSFGRAKLGCTFKNAEDGREMRLALRGDFFDRKATITLGDENGPVVAQIARDFLNAREIIWDSQTYYLTIAPGVDIALLAALCVCLDETEND